MYFALINGIHPTTEVVGFLPVRIVKQDKPGIADFIHSDDEAVTFINEFLMEQMYQDIPDG